MLPATRQFTPYVPTEADRENDRRVDEWKRERNRQAVLRYLERQRQERLDAAIRAFGEHSRGRPI